MLDNIKSRNKKSVKILSIVTIISFICCIALIKIAARKPVSPEFCARCHSMAPSYNTWKETVSCNTGCLNCHTHDDSGRTLSVEIEDSNCTNTDCHPIEKLTFQLSKYKKAFSFNHETHLKEFSPNLRLRCTGCHANVGIKAQESARTKHFDIDENACFICHFMNGEIPLLSANDKKRISECSLCHKDVQAKIMIYEKEFDHLKYERDLKVECVNCHLETVHESGNTEKKNCYYCHIKIPKGYDNADRMHNDHVKEHNVSCSPCHNKILHKWDDEYMNTILPQRNRAGKDKDHVVASDRTQSTDRAGVSGNTKAKGSVFEKDPYSLQREVYAGHGGMGVESCPDPMYLATVNCTACHTGNDMGVAPAVCNTCHEKGFDKTMAEQKEYIAGMLKLLSELLIESQRQGVSKSMIDEARYNYDLIINDGSLGVHNIKYAKDLIAYSRHLLKDNMNSNN